jgi:hypothetical protein
VDLLLAGPFTLESAARGWAGNRGTPAGRAVGIAEFCGGRLGIYYIGPPDGDSRNFPLRLLRFADGKTVELTRLDRPPWLEFSVSPDEKRLLFARLDSFSNEVMLVEDFR